MKLSDLTVARAGARDLDQITAVIASAIDAWPAPPRLKRNVLPILAYDEQDLTDHEILLLKELDRPVAVGAWQTNRHPASDERPGNADAACPHWFWQDCTSIAERCGEVAVAGLMRQPSSSAREVTKREGIKT